ncbi:MAG: response regulator, partial [Blautia sp.]|nr:response regulator [Blautia sp.]
MVKLFLAEDEIAMREGIKRTIPWKEDGIEFCGEAGDGELAWPIILEQRPDIVITDIKMPFMDGLQLAGLIRKELPDTKIVILSGYSEFEYAQEALRIGVTEYLLKPITPKKLREVVRALAASIEEEKKNSQERIDWLEEEQREKQAHDRRLLFRTLVSGGMNSHSILEKAEAMGVRLGAAYYRMVLLYVLEDENSRDQEKADGMLAAAAQEDEGCFVFEHSMDSLAILLTGKTPEETQARTDRLQERV